MTTKTKRMATRFGALAVIAAFAALGTATSEAPPEGATEEGPAATAVEAAGDESADPAPSGSGALSTLIARASREGYGEGPGAAEIARQVQDDLDSGDRVAVQVIPNHPRRRVVVVVQFTDLRHIDEDDRREYVEGILHEVRLVHGGLHDDIAVGIRGRVLFGAVASFVDGGPVQTQVGASVSSDPLERLLSAPVTPPPPIPEIALGATVDGEFTAEESRAHVHHLTVPADGRVSIQVRLRTDDDDFYPYTVVVPGRVTFGEAMSAHYFDRSIDMGSDGERVLRAGDYTLVTYGDPCQVDPEERCAAPVIFGYRLSVSSS